MEFRKSIRLKDYDYKTNGYYFVTICTNYQEKMFEPRISEKYGHKLLECVVADPWSARVDVVADPWSANKRATQGVATTLKKNTDIIEEKLLLLEKKFAVEIDFYCIMPDHIHLIIVIFARQGRATTKLCWIINAFKGWCTRAFNKSIFQPNYYEHIIRNEKALNKIRKYIANNPNAEKYNWDELEK